MESSPTIGWRPVAAALAVAMLAQWWLLPFVTSDIVEFNVPWFRHIVAAGPVHAFAAPFANYTPPYLYLLALVAPLHGLVGDEYVIKAVALAGNVALAAALWHLLRRAGAPPRPALLVLALPSVALNAALLGQCDALYAAPCVMAAAAALDRRHRAMLAWSGLALAVKAQAILFAPFVLAVLLARRVPLTQWPLATVGFFGALAPAWLAGWPASNLLTVYVRQADTFTDLARNAPNLWMLLPASGLPVQALTAAGILLTLLAAAVYLARAVPLLAKATPGATLRLALLAPLLTAGLLPKMHDRYFFLADVLALALAATVRDRDTIRIAILVQAGSAGAVMAYVSGLTMLAQFGAVAMIAATWLTAKPFVTAASPRPAVQPT